MAFDLEQHVNAIEARGYTVIDDFLSPPVLQEVRRCLSYYLGSHSGRNSFEGTRTERVYTLVARARVFWDVVLDARILALCDRFLLPNCLLTASQAISIGPGEVAQPFHSDDSFHHLPRPRAMISLSTIVAVDAFTEANGATRVVPGSHRWPRGQKPEPHEIADAVMPPGSAVLYLGSTLHGAGANSTAAEWRPGLHISYTLGWLRTEENNYLAVPPEIARTLPRQAQELLGYAVHDAVASAGGYLGMLGLRDPVELMGEGKL
jgi:ectoine hydroxylase-related dioxygenase (phytanoyl-CoA dioxygenase family)